MKNFWFFGYQAFSHNNAISGSDVPDSLLLNYTYNSEDYPILMESDYLDGEYVDHFEISFGYECK